MLLTMLDNNIKQSPLRGMLGMGGGIHGFTSPSSSTSGPLALPTGYTYWTGMYTNWAGSGTSTSGFDDYIPVAFPSSGKFYFETIANSPSIYREFGIKTGASALSSSYDDCIFGIYYNSPAGLFLTKDSGCTSFGSSITHGAGTGGPTVVNGDTYMWALDCALGQMWIGLNGNWYQSGNPSTGTNPSIDYNSTFSGFYFKIGYSSGGNSMSLTQVRY
jgi:hypothetical protein